MNWSKPNWYITPEEFANIIVRALEQTGHFKRNESVHPEDIVAAFTSHAEAIALGISTVGRKIDASEKKAVMQTKDLRKHALPIDDEIDPISDKELDYSESKYRNVTIK